MSDDLVKDLRFWNGGIDSDKKMQKAADRIEQLETNIELQLEWYLSNKRRLEARIEQLEAALREVAELGMWDGNYFRAFSRKKLENKNGK